jgi:hypothetical protein
MSDKATEKTPVVKPEILAMSEKIQKDISIDAKAGTATAAADIYEKTLPESLTMETIRSVRDHNTAFVAAGAHAFGTMAINAMKGQKDCKELNITMGMGDRDKVSHHVARQKVFTDHMHGGAEIVKYGVVSTSLEVTAGKNSGQLKVVKAAIGAQALAAFVK